RLLDIQGKMERAELKFAQIAQYEKALQTTRQQLATLEKANAKEVIALQRKLAHEKQIRIQIDTSIADLKTKTSQSATKGVIAGLRQLAAPADLRSCAGVRIGLCERGSWGRSLPKRGANRTKAGSISNSSHQ